MQHRPWFLLIRELRRRADSTAAQPKQRKQTFLEKPITGTPIKNRFLTTVRSLGTSDRIGCFGFTDLLGRRDIRSEFYNQRRIKSFAELIWIAPLVRQNAR